MINKRTYTFFCKNVFFNFIVTHFNANWNILIKCSLWVLCFLSKLCVIYPTCSWWTFSFFTGSHIIFLLCVSMEINLDVVFINVINGTLVGKYHLELDGISSTLFFVVAILASKFGIQPKTKFNTFIQKWSIWRNWTAVLSKDAMESSKLGCLLKWSASYPSDVSLCDYEFKFNCAEVSPDFPCIIHFCSLFFFFSVFLFISIIFKLIFHHLI